MGTEDVKVTAMNMYKYKEGLRFYKRRPCSTYISTDLRTVPTNSKVFLRDLLNMLEKQILTSVIEIQKEIWG